MYGQAAGLAALYPPALAEGYFTLRTAASLGLRRLMRSIRATAAQSARRTGQMALHRAMRWDGE